MTLDVLVIDRDRWLRGESWLGSRSPHRCAIEQWGEQWRPGMPLLMDANDDIARTNDDPTLSERTREDRIAKLLLDAGVCRVVVYKGGVRP